ncbi:bZIP transcription factor (Fcr3), putative [Talaromyces stipitatus ATCC 10500]|nr:bZIP transcription factor (Fcr3), putative [Talaromyces stipitatus ATCC 10500]EED20183.1 bZIP transcription factor (Fcr3), putative [Talaromyces stipitatus ATCC 10500]
MSNPNADHLGQYIFSEFLEDPLAAAQTSTRSSSEEKDVTTPAQDRRKAQNRAAQRAFRERKERRVKELEQKLTDLQAQSMTLHADNERLKRELAKVATENEILRATSSTGEAINDDTNNRSNHNSPIDDDSNKAASSSTTAIINGPKGWAALDVRKQYAADYKTGNLPHRVVLSAENGERLLDTKATWDLIQNHPLFQKGLVDIGDVCERLKPFTKCDGQGPVFEEGRVRKVIEESVACGNDELI